MQNPGRYALVPETFFAFASGAKTPCPPLFPAIMSRSAAAHDTWTTGPNVPPHAAKILVALPCTYKTHCTASCSVAQAGYTIVWPNHVARAPRWCNDVVRPPRTVLPKFVWPYIRGSVAPQEGVKYVPIGC